MGNTSDEWEEMEQYDYVDTGYFNKAVKVYSESIGEFLMNFSELEHELNIAIAEIISDRAHEMGYSIMERMAMRQKIGLFYRMYARLESAAQKGQKRQLNSIKKNLISLSEFRNTLAHANWGTVQKNGNVRTKILSDKESGLVRFKNIVIKPGDIRRKTKEVIELSEEISLFSDEALSF